MSTQVKNIPQKLYLLGHPIAHSASPAMYNAIYEHLGLPWRYDLMDCETESAAKTFLDARDFLSINITTPYKPLALRAATASAASAKLARGANVLIRKGEALIAYNTDGQGCVAYLEREGVCFRGASVAVCGTGPTALAIVHAASIAGAREVVLLSREKERSRKVLKAYVEAFGKLAYATLDLPAASPRHRSFREAYEKTKFKYGSYTTSTQAISGADIIIDATSLGMCPHDPAPFDPSLFRENQFAFDVVYGHGETAFCAGARKAGCEVRDGQGMLVAQAAITVQTVCDIAEIALDEAFPDFDSFFSFLSDASGF